MSTEPVPKCGRCHIYLEKIDPNKPYGLWKCPSCGMVYRDPRLDPHQRISDVVKSNCPECAKKQGLY